ncbi:hypothetical protein F4814DRAFT_401753 [Daldinia grandis]|nr:hypothetical protein F4814DRAFT_401753 [Daldinia grandis]
MYYVCHPHAIYGLLLLLCRPIILYHYRCSILTIDLFCLSVCLLLFLLLLLLLLLPPASRSKTNLTSPPLVQQMDM